MVKQSVLTEIRDLEAVIEYAGNRPYGNPQEIILMGCSQGGLVSAMTASRLNFQKLSKKAKRDDLGLTGLYGL